MFQVFVGYAVRTCGGSVICRPDSLGNHCRVKGGDLSVLVHILCRRRSMCLSWGRVGNLLVEA